MMNYELTQEEETALIEYKILEKNTVTGKRRVSQGLFSSFYVPSFRSAPPPSSISSVSVQVISKPFSPDAMFDLPIRLESIESLEHIGFENVMAVEILERWTNRQDPDASPDTLFEYVKGHLDKQNSACFEGLSDSETMRRLGIKNSIAEAILNPAYSMVRGTESLDYWIEDTIRVNWATLQNLLRRLKAFGVEAVEHNNSSKAKLTSSSSDNTK